MSLLLHLPLFYSCQEHTQFLTRTWDIRSFIIATNLLHLRILRVYALLKYFEFIIVTSFNNKYQLYMF